MTGPCLCWLGSPVDESPPPTSSELAGSEPADAKATPVEPGRVELAPPRRRFRRPRRWSLLAIVVLALFAVYVLPTPWALHIGDRFTPLETWDGFGAVRASNGGHYVLFTHLRGGIAGGGYASPCGVHSCDTLHGNAKLCAANGATYSLRLNGDVHAWWSTDGARTLIELTGRPLPGGWVVAFKGRWTVQRCLWRTPTTRSPSCSPARDESGVSRPRPTRARPTSRSSTARRTLSTVRAERWRPTGRPDSRVALICGEVCRAGSVGHAAARSGSGGRSVLVARRQAAASKSWRASWRATRPRRSRDRIR